MNDLDVFVIGLLIIWFELVVLFFLGVLVFVQLDTDVYFFCKSVFRRLTLMPESWIEKVVDFFTSNRKVG